MRCRAALREPGFGERTPSPGEAVAVPTLQRRNRDAVLRRMDEPAVAEVDAGVVDLARLRPLAVRAPEEHVARLELVDRDPLRARHLAAHLERRAAAQRAREAALAGVGLQLV